MNHGILHRAPFTRHGIATGLSTTARLCKAIGHPSLAYISVPSGFYSTTRTYPVVLGYTGSDQGWLAYHDAFASARNSNGYPFIIVSVLSMNTGGSYAGMSTDPEYTPYYPSSIWSTHVTNDADRPTFDQNGFEAWCATLTSTYRASSFFLTGFSGGGKSAWMHFFNTPQLIRAFGAAAANYPTAGGGYNASLILPAGRTPPSTSPARVTLPFKCWVSDDVDDQAVLGAQMAAGRADALAAGYGGVESTVVVPGVGHTHHASLISAWFYSKLTAPEQ